MSSNTRASFPTLINQANTCGLIVQDFDQLNYVFVGREEFKGLDLFEFLYFLYGLKFLFHAFDRDIFARLERIGHKNLGKGAVASLGLESVLVHRIDFEVRKNII